MNSSANSETNNRFYVRDSVPFLEEPHEMRIKKRLIENGFENYKINFNLRLDSEIYVVTGVDIAEFDETKHHATPTKAYIAQTGYQHLLNQSAAVALELLEKGKRVLILTAKSQETKIKKIISKCGYEKNCRIITPELHEVELLDQVYSTLFDWTKTEPTNGINFLIYDSFMPSLNPSRRDRPFAPIYEETIVDMQRLVSRRLAFLHRIGMMCYDFALTYDQEEIRFVMISSLAARRPGGNLYVDALHKSVSSVFIETIAKEFAVQEIKTKFIGTEIAPGVVDRGPYDRLSTRQATIERAKANGFPYENLENDEIGNFPQLSTKSLGELSYQYLTAPLGTQIEEELSEESIEYLTAGRSMEDLIKTFRESCVIEESSSTFKKIGCKEQIKIDRNRLPSYIYNSDVIGGLPEVKVGFTFIPVVPKGQFF